MDCTDIDAKQILRHLRAYTNRKFKTTVKLQAVCDRHKRFMDISCAYPGSIHDARVFSLSSLSRGLEERLRRTPYHILADSAYALTIRVMTPFRDNGHLTAVSTILF